MPRIAKELSAVSLRRLSPGVHAVGGVAGLLLQVRASGSRSWLLRASVGGRRAEMGLGAFPEVGLAEARVEAARLKSIIRAGGDPLLEKKERRAALLRASRQEKTFSEVFHEYSTEKMAEFRSEKYRTQWKSSIQRHALPLIGDMLVKSITLDDIKLVLDPLWLEKTETASKLQGRLEKIMAYGIVKGYRDSQNPAVWKNNLSVVLASPARVSQSQNYPALMVEDTGRWWKALNGREGVSARALEFLAMTVARTGAVRFMRWDEIDLKNGIWTIQPGRIASKIPPVAQGGRPHKVPLTDEMVDLLVSQPRRAANDLVFPAQGGSALSDAALAAVMKKIHHTDISNGGVGYFDRDTLRPAVPHGIRSTFKTWCRDATDYEYEMSEVALSHKVGSKVAQAYDRSQLIEKRRGLMERWMMLLQNVK